MRCKLMITLCLLAAPALQGATAAERPTAARPPHSEGLKAARKSAAETAGHRTERTRNRSALTHRDLPADLEREREEHDHDSEND